jgi:hypothetical protein
MTQRWRRMQRMLEIERTERSKTREQEEVGRKGSDKGIVDVT